MSSLSINNAIEETLQFVRSINRYFEHKAPWKLVKEDLESAGTVLYTGAEALRICAILLSPIMPKRMKLLRYGERGDEKPGLIDGSGDLRDLANEIEDITPDIITPSGVKSLKSIEIKILGG